MIESITKCWICGEPGTSGEHKTKRSDLRSVFGEISQSKPLFYHDDKSINVPIKGLNSKRLKSSSVLCAKCNNERTQPHDKSWQQLSDGLRSIKGNLKPGRVVRTNRIFRYDTSKKMLNVHLCFLKLFGCHVVEAGVNIDVQSFSQAILNNKSHQNVYLKFGYCPSFDSTSYTEMSDIHLDDYAHDGTCAFATWIYAIDGVVVNVMYSAPGEKRTGVVDSWHPKFGTNRLIVGDFGE